MKNLGKLFILMITLVLLSSCGSSSYIARYSVGLKSVESPADAKQQYGETKVVSYQEGDYNKYRYSDDYITIVWYVGSTQFNFDLTNKSNYSIKINWDDISYVDYNGQTERLMHSGVKYTDRNSSQPATTIPKGASLSDILLPTNNVYYVSSVGWQTKYLLPCVYKNKEAMETGAQKYVGKTMTIIMPIMIENVQNDYTFSFNVEELLPYKK